MGQQKEQGADVAAQLSSAAFFLVAGPVVIFVNRHILKALDFHYSMAVSSLGLATSSIICAVLVALGVVELKQGKNMSWSFYMKKIMPIGLTSAATIYFGNLAYLYLSVAFVQICKAFGPVITMLMAFSAGIEHPTGLLIFAIVAISIGTSVSSYGELHFSLIGVLVIMSAQFAEGIKLILSQILMSNLKFSVWEGLYFMGPAATIWLLIGCAMHEIPQIVEKGDYMKIVKNPGLFLIAGLGGFCVNLAVYMVVKTTSGLTLKVLATIRNIGIVVASSVFLGESLTPLEVVGYLISLVGFAAYNRAKMQKTEKKGISKTKPDLRV